MSEPLSLAEFLRTRRERLSPATVGLPAGTRRRTPGLRREEVAALAGISVDYLIRIEQGRDLTPSHAVTGALAEALQLNTDERGYLFALAMCNSSGTNCDPPEQALPLRPATVRLLERLEPLPAYVMERTTRLVAWNESYARLVAGTGLLEMEEPSLLRFVFGVERSSAFFRDWSAIAVEQVENLRAVSAMLPRHLGLPALISELEQASPEFALLWQRHDVGAKDWGTHRLTHTNGDHISVTFETLTLPDPSSDRRLIIHEPADAASAAALERLVPDAVEGGSRLRLVGNVS